jgi:hypothetical protein
LPINDTSKSPESSRRLRDFASPATFSMLHGPNVRASEASAGEHGERVMVKRAIQTLTPMSAHLAKKAAWNVVRKRLRGKRGGTAMGV